ncbi:hypothetical protein N7455_000352 [Penicillium solitum]|uniref:uncharacterized protein n=1 Tax=Penicillium solitum TaxID=60172 RepID=UPI0032C4ACDE|nr:hypothetical protein N7455_000352 [Penicillium solitum]
MNEISESNAEAFATARLPLYHGPLVKVRIQTTCEYEVSKALLCAESPVFTIMFEGSFREAQEQAVDLELMEGVISKRSVEALFQWLYLRIVKFNIDDPEEKISAAIELARLADRYEITGIESQTAEYIKEVILANPDPEYKMDPCELVYNQTFFLRAEHIISGTLLHDGHPVRRALAGACVADFLENYPHKFADTAQEHPEFAVDLLHELCSKETFESPKNKPQLYKKSTVLSIQSFDALLRWIYHRIIQFDETFEESCIKAAVELAKLAEMYGITGIEAPIAKYIKDIYATSGHLNGEPCRHILPDNEDKALGTGLREGHPVRRVMAQAFVLTYLHWPKYERYHDELSIQEFPKFEAGLLFEVR